MRRFGIELMTTLFIFLGGWYALSQVDWLAILNFESKKDQTAEKLGDLLWERVEDSETMVRDDQVVNRLDTLMGHLCQQNTINCDDIKLHIVKKDQVNAFALPDGHLVIFSGLINYCDNQEELCGVIGHEIAHIKENHVMKKLVKELGLSLLVTVTSGSTGGNAAGRIFKILSSSAYDRDLEREADKTAVQYLESANLDPKPFADLLYRFGDDDSRALEGLLSTHPNPKDRAKSILKFTNDDNQPTEKVLSRGSWDDLQEAVES